MLVEGCYSGMCANGANLVSAAFKEEKSDNSMMMIAGVVIALVILAGAGYMLM